MTPGTWLVHPSTPAALRAELARDGAAIVESWWVKVPVWTADAA